MKPFVPSKPEPKTRNRARTLACLALLLLSLVSAGGCASFASVAAPVFGETWDDFAKQTQSSVAVAPSAPRIAPVDEDLPEVFKAVPQARESVRRAAQVLKSKSVTRTQIQSAMADLEKAEVQVQKHSRTHPGLVKEMTEKLEEIRQWAEERLLEILKIEASFDLSLRCRIRVAVVKIGEGVETIDPQEASLWKAFLFEAGFHPSVLFISPGLAGDTVSAAAVRVAGARLGADAVLAYTTFAATTSSLFGESAASLCFAKCMFVDLRTEYLFFNAEGECKERKVSLPFTVCPVCLEEKCLSRSVTALHKEIQHELDRLDRNPQKDKGQRLKDN